MGKIRRKFLYRIFCMISLAVAVYLIVELKISQTLDMRMTVVFILLFVVIIWGIVNWSSQYSVIQKQEEELRMYQLYIQPMEELVKDIRARQHEFDNHMNAVLNMHLTVDTYEELVDRQSAYRKDLKTDDNRKYLPLLRISDKVLAGFLYSKIVSTKEYIQTELEVKNLAILSGTSEHSVIEIVGTLVDNAFEACTQERNQVRILLDSEKDKLIFQIKNQFPKQSMDTIGRYFDKGYTTKGKESAGRGLGLYNAKILVQQSRGEITVGQECIENENYICFKVIL